MPMELASSLVCENMLENFEPGLEKTYLVCIWIGRVDVEDDHELFHERILEKNESALDKILHSRSLAFAKQPQAKVSSFSVPSTASPILVGMD